MIALLLGCPTPDTTVAPEVIATPETPPTPPAVPITATARASVDIQHDAEGREHPTTSFHLTTVDSAGIEASADGSTTAVCVEQQTEALAAWLCDGIHTVELVARAEAVALVRHDPSGDLDLVTLPVPANAVVTWRAPTPAITVPVRLRYDAIDGRTHLVVEAFEDTAVVASGSVDVDGSCVPSASPPAGREDGNVYLTCTSAVGTTLVKLVERDRKAALTRRPSGTKAALDEVFYELAPPDGVTFDL
jgi:hypothetical protein